MKLNLPVTSQAHPLSDTDIIISTTDLKGTITSVNQDFQRISGFGVGDLLGKNHNVVRHPDMPAAGFADLWASLKRSEPWIGVVKNRCKNGDYYWVDAYVAPIYDGDKQVGYQSVRTRPKAEDCDRAEKLYARIRTGKLPLQLRWRWTYTQLLFGGFMAVLLPVLAVLWYSGAVSLTAAIASLTGGTALSLVAAFFIGAPIRAAGRRARQVTDNAIAQFVYGGRRDEPGQFHAAMSVLEARLRTMVSRVEEHSVQLSAAAEQTAATAQETDAGIREQQLETDQVATAMNEMNATVREVANNASRAASAAHAADEEANKGRRVVSQAIDVIEGLSSDVDRSAETILALAKESENISKVLDVIKGIAEQTNLLALNAAIEAARAGEQGRGFAVVADEVRTLASRTQSSTAEIHAMIERLQKGSSAAVQAMEQSRANAQQGVEQAGLVGISLDSISSAVTTINDMNMLIASAAEEQTAVAEEINRNLSNISMVADRTAQGSRDTTAAVESVSGMAHELRVLIKQVS